MSLRAYLKAIRKNWHIVTLVFLIASGGAAFRTFNTPPTYSSTVTFFVTTPAAGTGSALQGDEFGQQRVNSYVQLLRSERLARRVIDKEDLSLTAAQLISRVSASAELNTVLVKAEVADGSRARSLAIARGISTEFIDLVDEIETQDGARPSPVHLEVISGPTLKPFPIAPSHRIDLLLGMAVGLAVGVGLALLRELLDSSIRSPEALKNVAQRPILGVITMDRGPKGLGALRKQTPNAENYRQLRTNLQFTNIDRPVKVVVVTSAVAGEGKSTVTANLARMIAEAGRSVVVVEADLRRPGLARHWGMDASIGLTDILAGNVVLDDVLQKFSADSVTLLASGSIPPNPAELVGSQHMSALMAELRERYDMVLVDTPPVLPVTDGAVLAALADGVLVVVRHGKTSRSQVATAVQSLTDIGAQVLGMVFNMAPSIPGGERYVLDSYATARKTSRFSLRRRGAAPSVPPTAARHEARPGAIPTARPEATPTGRPDGTAAPRHESGQRPDAPAPRP